MSALLDMIRQRKAELERQQQEAEAAKSAALSASITDDQRVVAIERLIAAALVGSAPAIETLDKLRAASPDLARFVDMVAGRLDAQRAAPDGPAASEPSPAAAVAPRPVERTSEPPAAPVEPLPLGMLPDAVDFVPPAHPPVSEPLRPAAAGHRIQPVEAPVQGMPALGPAVVGEPVDPIADELKRLWRRGLPSGVARVVEVHGWPAVVAAAMRRGETAREFKARVEVGHAQADEAAAGGIGPRVGQGARARPGGLHEGTARRLSSDRPARGRCDRDVHPPNAVTVPERDARRYDCAVAGARDARPDVR